MDFLMGAIMAHDPSCRRDLLAAHSENRNGND